MLGFLVNYTIIVHNPTSFPGEENVTVFEKTYPVMIEYPADLTCTPYIHLSNW